MHSVRVLHDVLPELLVEQRPLSRTRDFAASLSLDRGFARRSDRRAAGCAGRSVPALSLPHDHELREYLPQRAESGEGDRGDQKENGRAAALSGSQSIERRRSGRRFLFCKAEEDAMIDHIGFPVSDYEKSKAFYAKALAPLGYTLIMEVPGSVTESGSAAAGFGANGKPDFWIGGEGGLGKCMHVAILARDRAAVDAFYRAALAAGGKDNGAPGLRPHYHKDYYGAFVLDLDGHNIEAVCHAPA